MDVIYAVEAIKHKFAETVHPTEIPLLINGSFTADLTDAGVNVDNLGNQPFLHWAAFQEAVCILIQNGGRARRGDAMGSRLGEAGFPMNSVEGHIARVVYGRREGDAVFRRITPIACILIWAGICEAAPNELVLRDFA